MRLELGEDLLEGAGAVGGGVELRADPSDRPVGLGRQEDRGEADEELHRPGRQPQTDDDRDDRDRDRRQQLQGGGGHEGQPQGAHRRAAVPLAHGADDLNLALRPPVAHEGRKSPHDVEEVPGEVAQRAPPAVGVLLRRRPDEGGEEGEERHGEDDDDRARPVHDDEAGDREHRHDRGRDERGEVLRDVGLDGARPLGGERQGAVPTGALLDGPRRPRLEQVLSQPGRHEGAGAGGDRLRCGAEQGTKGEQPADPQRRPEQGVAAHDGDDEGGQREGRPDRRDALCHTDAREGSHRPAGGRDHPQDAWVEGLHLSAPRWAAPRAAAGAPPTADGGRSSSSTPCSRA